MYWTPWSVSRPWLPRANSGTDEWHNRSVYVILPFLGGLAFFWERDFDQTGEEHIASYFDGAWEGHYDITCGICNEIRSDTEQDRPF